MIRLQKIPVRSVNNQQSVNETIQSSNNVGDIQSYIGKILTINHQQFIVEDILGQGGFAFVFLVRSYNQQRYALKRMYVNNQRDLNICQREICFVKEFSSHPNIIKYVDSDIHCLSKSFYENNNDDQIYEILLLTEYCSNGTLITRLNDQRNVGITLNERQILRIFADICNAVSACHFRRPQPILHRDIKLENILIDPQQNYILCDFGSAIQLSSSSSTTNDYQQYQTHQLTTNIIQQLEEEIQRYTTLSYRAPELIDLYSREPITLKVDIWAMGCLLYKLMYNTMPFGESILAIQNGTFVIPDDMSHVYSRELNLFVRYMLEIDINKRPDIWQVSYMTYKILGNECPIPNRCRSKIPDLNGISMPLKDSESRHQRKQKSTSTNLVDDSVSLGTAVNPRERPRGMPSSASLINFNQTNQQRSPAALIPPPSEPPSSSASSNPTRSGSAAQLMFDDDFSKIPSHAISLTNIPTVTTTTTTTTTTTKNEQILSRARPSPPATVSAASGFALQQQSFPPPPSSSYVPGHRRSSSQILSPTNNQLSFQNASSIDSPNKNGIFNNEQISSSESDDDDKSISPKNQKMKSKNHHPSMEGAKKILSFTNKYTQNESTIVQPVNFSDNGFDQLVNENSDDEQKATKAEHNNKINPFLRAPFHHSPTNKQTSISTFDANSIVMGKRTSAFTPYQKQEINSISSNNLSSSTDVFTNAPFKTKSKTKQHSTTNEQKKTMMNDAEPKQNAYNSMADEYF